MKALWLHFGVLLALAVAGLMLPDYQQGMLTPRAGNGGVCHRYNSPSDIRGCSASAMRCISVQA